MQFSQETMVGSHRLEPGKATPVVMDPALALARKAASELKSRVDELEAENRRLQLALGMVMIEKEGLEKQLQGKRRVFKRT